MKNSSAEPFSTECDGLVLSMMLEGQIVGLSVALTEKNQIKATTYGYADQKKSPLSNSTLFQAASISKAVAALGALRLVEAKKLSLDIDINTILREWKVPASPFTETSKVTLRHLLSHGAGVNVHGFPDYPFGSPVPTLMQTLLGVEPSNVPAIAVDMIPGTKKRYSGGGYVILQLLITEAGGMPFPDYMQKAVLEPLGMASSTFKQPLPESLHPNAATGHALGGVEIQNRWHVYPEMAAAGLWTTSSDLARFVIEVQNCLKHDGIISSSMAREMLTPQTGDDGLGLFLSGHGRSLRFYHSGRNAGFDAVMMALAEQEKGLVIMSNTNANPQTFNKIMQRLMKEYRW